MNRMHSWSAALVAMCLVFGGAREVAAQSPMSRVLDLNREAMNAYQMLEIEQAREHLLSALQTAEAGNVTGAPLARTYLNLGVIAVGGFGDNGAGMQYFQQALAIDGSVQLDPLTSTPEIQTVFDLARQRAGGGGPSGGGGQGGGGASVGGQGGGGQGGGGSSVGGNLSHRPVPEQLAQTAVPVYIEAPSDAAQVYLYYKGHGMREFRRVEMRSVASGYGYEIPCSDVYQPAVEYYIVAFASDGSPVGFAGSQSEPVSVAIVGSRTQPAPALPGRAPPETCVDRECPPGMEGCNAGGGAGMGSSCISDSDCGSGLECRESMCSVAEGGGGGDDIPHFFFRASLGGAFGYVGPGMTADSVAPDQREGADPSDLHNDGQGLDWDPGAWIPPGSSECPGEGSCVRVGQAGFVPNFQIRLAAGYHFHGFEYLGVAVFARFAPMAGHGDLASVLIGGRLQVRPLVDLEKQGGDLIPILTLFAGFSGGQVQHQPPANGPNAPWIISGLNGVPVGVSGGIRFGKHIGIYGEAEMMFQFPTFMFNLDLSAGIEVGF